MRIVSPSKDQMEELRGILNDRVIDRVNRGELLSHAVVDVNDGSLIAIYVIDVYADIISVVNYFCVPEYADDYDTHMIVFDDIQDVAEAAEIGTIVVPADAFEYEQLKNYLEDYGFTKEMESKIVSDKVGNVVKAIPKTSDDSIKPLGEATELEKNNIKSLIKENFERNIEKKDLKKTYDQDCSMLCIKKGEIKGLVLGYYTGGGLYLEYLYTAKDAGTAVMALLGEAARKALELYGEDTKLEAVLINEASEKIAKKVMANGEFKDFGIYRWDIA